MLVSYTLYRQGFNTMVNYIKTIFKNIILFLVLCTTSNLSANTSSEHNLTDTQLHAFLGILTNFILSEDKKISIVGSPRLSSNVYDSYQFKPQVVNPYKRPLVYSIQNEPSWADFNTTTGLLQGSPSSSDKRDSPNIIISVSDGTYTVNLASFNIKVNPAIDISHTFGKATQGTEITYNYYKDPSLAIDNNDDTWNHTSGGAKGNNWLQIELPSPTKISKIVFQNKTPASRFQNSKMYISNTPYTGTVDENDFIKTLASSNSEQMITFDTPVSGTYVLIKGDVRSQDDRHLHLRKLEVYGEMPVAPILTEHESTYLLSVNTSIGSVVTTFDGIDYQGDTLVYSIDNDLFSIDQSGNLLVQNTLTSGEQTVHITISDGINSTTSTVVISITSKNAIEEALSSGSVTNISEKELLQAAIDEIDASKMLEAKAKIFNFNTDGSVKDDGLSLTNISWNPTHDASLLTSTFGQNTPLLLTNAVTVANKPIRSKEIAIIGNHKNTPYVVFGSNPFRNSTNNDMQKVLENTLSWLTKRDNLKESPFNIVITHLDESYYFKDESRTRAWLDTHYAGQVSYNQADACDGVALQGCLDNTPDLLIISQIATASDDTQTIANTVNEAMKNGIPVLYIHHNGNQTALGKALFSSVFDVGYRGG